MHTKRLADYIHKLSYSDLTRDEIENAKMCVEDLIGVALVGAKSKTAQIWKQHLLTSKNEIESTAWNETFQKYACDKAAAYNAAVSHLIDMDDVHTTSITHLGTVSIPTAIAYGQKLHRTGRELITAIVAAYEIGARIGEAVNPSAYYYWHTTAIVGSFCAATAAGKLIDLSPHQLHQSYGSAGTQASGLWEFLKDGAMSKTLHTANSTLCGIRAAELAKLGFTGANQILEGEKGLVRAISPNGDFDALTRGLGIDHHRIMGNALKPYACCRHTHSAITAVEEILKEQPIEVAEIEEVVDYTYQVAIDTTDSAHPSTPYGHKFSLQYCIAAAFVYETMMEDTFSEEKIEGRIVKHLMGKVKVIEDKELTKINNEEPDQWPHRVVVKMKNGETLSKEISYPLGDPKNPFDWDKVDNKFLQLTGTILSKEKVERLIENIHNLEQNEDISEIFE